jgi:predicted HTH domain antitoxin
MPSVSVEVPDDLLARLGERDADPGRALRLAVAFSLCSAGDLSTSQAARLAGMTYGDFLEAASRAKVQLFPVDLEELKEEVSCGYTLGRERVPGHSALPPGTT